MSDRFPHGSDGSARGRPRRVVASFDSYADAERAVDHLADDKFPVEHVTIVGRDLSLVEQVVGRMTYARAALQAALSGALVGLLIGWLFALFDWFDPVVARGWLILDGLWFGALVGALYGLLAHAMTGGRRDFASIGTMQAARYDILVDEDVADEASRLLARRTPAPADERGSAPDRVPAEPSTSRAPTNRAA
jgi:hypothetical protein